MAKMAAEDPWKQMHQDIYKFSVAWVQGKNADELYDLYEKLSDVGQIKVVQILLGLDPKDKSLTEERKELIPALKEEVERNYGGEFNAHNQWQKKKEYKIKITPPEKGKGKKKGFQVEKISKARQIEENFYYPAHSGYASGYGSIDRFKRSDRYKRGRGRGAAASLVDFNDYYYDDDSDGISAYQGGLDDDAYYYDLFGDEYNDEMNGYTASAKWTANDNGARSSNYYGLKAKEKQRGNHGNRYGRRGLMGYMGDGDISGDLMGLILSVILFIGFIALCGVGYRYKMRKRGMDRKYCEMEKETTNDGDADIKDKEQV